MNTDSLETLNAIARKVAELDLAIAAMDAVALTAEMDAADQLLFLARVGARYHPIISQVRSHNCNTCSHPDVREYHIEKGILLLSTSCDDETRDGTSHYEHDMELWLTADGLLGGNWQAPVSHWQNAWNTATRSVDVISLAAAIEVWGLERIVEAVQEILTKRVTRLGKRAGQAAKREAVAQNVLVALRGGK